MEASKGAADAAARDDEVSVEERSGEVIAKSSAALCRAKGWKVGTILEGSDGRATTRIRLTAIGEEGVLAMMVGRDGERFRGYESPWTLLSRRWRKVGTHV